MSDTSTSAIRWQAATLVAVAVAVILGAMWWSARDDIEEVERKLDAALAESNAGPALDVEVRDALSYDAAVELATEDLVSIRFTYLSEEDEVELRDLLEDLGFDDDIMQRIGASRAVDGMLTALGDDVQALWTYHPEMGLRMVLRR